MGIGLRMWSPVDITAIYMSGDCPSNSILQMPLVFIDFYTTMHMHACALGASPFPHAGPFLLLSFLILRLFFLAVLELGAPLSSFLEGALYKCSI